MNLINKDDEFNRIFRAIMDDEKNKLSIEIFFVCHLFCENQTL